MWIILFALSIAAAIAFGLAAIMFQRRSGIQSWISGGNRRAGQSDLLLYRRMRLLDLDAAEVARADPLSFWELEARCRTCNSKERCACDLADNSRDWREYCPNGLMLDLLRTSKALFRSAMPPERR
jgi:Family of unknown function (DUF6455)